jgi:organic radical activating enzyme
MSDPVFIKEVFSSLQGEGHLAGCRQIFIRLVECNLDCCYCDTDHGRQVTCSIETEPGTARFNPLQQPISLQKLVEIVSSWCKALPIAHHSISVTGGEPLLHAETLTAWLPELRRFLPIHLETNGTMPIALNRVINHLDYISMDMKLPSTSGCTEHLWDLHHSFLLASIGHTVSVKIVIGEDTSLDEIRQVCDIIRSVERSTPLYLQPVSLGDGGLGISPSRIFLLQETASANLPNVRVIPQMHRMLGAL